MNTEGYPDENELKKIKEWGHEDYPALMYYIEELWSYSDRFLQKGDVYYLSTGGWSGNESLIEALEENALFWCCCWQKSERGGHYWFEVKERA